MRRKQLGKRLTAYLLSFAVAFSSLTQNMAAAENVTPIAENEIAAESEETADIQQNGITAPEDGENSDISGEAVETIVYHEVTYLLPADSTEEEAEKTVMEPTAMVPDGTMISELEIPERSGCLFLNWYYDENLEQIAGDRDNITKDVTLYPKFAEKEGMDDTYRNNFVSSEDQPSDFTVVLYTENMTAEEVEEAVLVQDMTNGEEMAFSLVEIPAPIAEDNQENTVESANVDENADTDESADAEEAADTDGTETALVLRTEEEDAAIAAFDAAQEKLAGEGIAAEDASEADYLSALGLSEEDTLERYFLEDMGLSYDAVLRMQEKLDLSTEKEAAAAWYQIVPDGGHWPEGKLYQAVIPDTESIRFYKDEALTESEVIYYNFSIHKDAVSNLRLNPSIVFIPADEVEGVELGVGLYEIAVSGDELVSEENADAGILNYTGELELRADDIIAVYDGILNEDLTVDGELGYFKIVSEEQNASDETPEADNELATPSVSFSYVTPELLEVVFVPDNIPVLDDGSFEDGTIEIQKEFLDFSDPLYEEIGLNARTTLDEGDYLSFYAMPDENSDEAGSAIGYGCILTVEEQENTVLVTYETATLEEMQVALDLFTIEENLEIPMTEEQMEELARQAQNQMEESGFAEEAADYMTGLIMNDEEMLKESGCEDALLQASFETEDGTPMTLEEVRLLASGGGTVSIKANSPSFNIGTSLVHFKNKGRGARVTATAGFTITINLNKSGNKQNTLVITGTVKGEQEILLDTSCSASSVWTEHQVFLFKIFGRKVYAYYWTLDDIQVTMTLKVGTYTGLGFTAVVKTDSEALNKDTPWGQIVGAEAEGLDLGTNTDSILNNTSSILQTVEKIKKVNEDTSKTSKDSTVTGTLPDKYSSFMKTSSSRITLLDKRIFEVSAGVDPLHIINVSLFGDFVVSLDAKAMLGFGISFATAKQYSFTIRASARTVYSSEADIEEPNFQLNFYLFGMLDVRAGIRLDARIGFISTKLASVGIRGELGVYMKLYGFLFITYSWTKSRGGQSSIEGSLLFEIGIYLTISFYAQAGNGRVDYTKSLYTKEWPLITLGAENFPTDFMITQDDTRLNLEMNETMSAIVFGDLYKINSMSLRSGAVSASSMDSRNRSNLAYAWTVNGQRYEQYNEENFYVESHDLTGEGGSATNNHSFIYLPESNTIMVKPAADFDGNDLWGEISFTYRNNTFGLNSKTIKRVLTVHWIPKKVTSPVEYQLEQEDGSYIVDAEDTLTGYQNIEYSLVIDKEAQEKYEGYVLDRVVLTQNGKESVLSSEEGSIARFLLNENNTKVSYYYKASKTKVTWNLMTPEDDTKVSMSEEIIALPGQDMRSLIPEDMAKEAENNAGYHVEWYLISENQKETIDKVPRKAAEVQGIYLKNSFKVNWMDGETVIKTEELPFGEKLTAPETEKEGYTLIGWKIGDTMLTSDAVVPAYEVTAAAVWEKNDYEVNWQIDGITVANSKAPFGAPLYLYAPDRSKTGYTFAWTTIQKEDGSTEVFSEESTLPAQNLVITGEWKVNEYKLSWIVDGTLIRQEQTAYGSTLTIPEDTAKEGYTLTPWKIGLAAIVDCGIEAEELTADFTMPAEDTTLGAHWIANVHKAIWKSDDAEILSEDVAFGQKLTMPEVPGKEGYTMTGWNLGEEAWKDYMTMPDEDITLTAVWEVNVHNVTWKIDDAASETAEAAYGDTLTAPQPAEKEGYTMAGWKLGEDKWTAEMTMPDEDIEIEAVWEKNVHTVTWKIDENTTETTDVAYGEKITAPQPAEKEGYTMTGWKLGEDEWTEETVMPDEDITITAVWEVNRHTVTWVVDGETVYTEEAAYGSTLAEPAMTEKTGHERSAWTVDGKSLAGFTMPDEDIEIEAVWEKNVHTVTWKIDENTTETTDVAYGEKITAPQPAEKEGYTMTGWKLGEDEWTEETVMPDEDITIIAEWEVNKHTVTWVVDGETVYTEEAAYGSTLTEPAVTEKIGHERSVWTVDGRSLDGFTMPDKDITITASHSAREYNANWISDGGSVGGGKQKFGSELVAPTLTKEGYTLKGWMVDGQFLTPGSKMPAGDFTAEAVWEINQYHVSWIVGTEIVKTEILDYHTVLVPPTVEKEHYKLSEWKVNGAALSDGFAVPASDITITASWIQNENTATWKDSISGEVLDSCTIPYGQYLPSDPDVIPPSGFSLKGWFVDGQKKTRNMTMPDNDITIVAEYEPTPRTVVWMTDTSTTTTNVQVGSTPVPPDVIKQGYTLTGWMMNDQMLTSSYKMPDEEIVFARAQWEINYHTISWMVDGKEVKKETVAYGTPVAAPTMEPKTGYDFSGWKYGNNPLASSLTMPDEDIRIEGSWVHNTHIWDNGTVKTKATCSAEGEKEFKCTICGETKKETIPMDRSNHAKSVVKNKEEATCGNDGYTGDTFCDKCKVLIQEGTVIPTNGQHKWDDGKETVKATCLKEGTKTYTCKNCEDTKEERIPVNPSNHVSVVTINAVKGNCLKDGYTGDEHCQDCGATVKAGSIIKAAGKHTWDEGTVTKEAAATETGVRTYKCTVCNEKKTEMIRIEPLIIGWDGGIDLDYPMFMALVKELHAVTLSDIEPAWFYTACIGEDLESLENIQAELAWIEGDTPITFLDCQSCLKLHIKPADERIAEKDVEMVFGHSDHSWEVSDLGTSCAEEGMAYLTCYGCNERVELKIPPNMTNHVGEEVIIKVVTGGKTYIDTICETCGALLKEELQQEPEKNDESDENTDPGGSDEQ